MVKTIFSRQWALRWVVIGLLVSFLSQFVETIKTTKESRDAQAKYEAQMKVATNSLDIIQEMVTKFQTVHMECEFELPQTDARVAALASEFHRWVTGVLPIFPNLPAALHVPVTNVGTTNAIIYLDPANLNQPAFRTAWPSLQPLSNFWSAFPLMAGTVWINRTNRPVYDIVTLTGRKSDLFMFDNHYGTNRQCQLIYYESEKKIYIKPGTFDCDAKNTSCWIGNSQIKGFHHLAGSQLVIGFNWRPLMPPAQTDPLRSIIRLDLITLTLDDVNIFLREFQKLGAKPKAQNLEFLVPDTIWGSTFTNEENILNGTVLPPRRLSGFQ